MSERLKLHSELVRDWLQTEGRKHSWLSRELMVSGSLVNKMLCEGYVPKRRTLERLAVLMGCQVTDLLITQAAMTA